MLTIAPVSVVLVGLLGMLVVAFAVTRMIAAEKRLARPVMVVDPGQPQPVSRVAV